jgi:hypothetical protein
MVDRLSGTCSMIAAMKTKGALLWELNSPFKVEEIDSG